MTYRLLLKFRPTAVAGLLLLLSTPSLGAKAVGLSPEPARFRDPQLDLYHSVLGAVLAPKLPEGSCFQMVSATGAGPEEIVFHDCIGEAGGEPGKLVHLVAERSIKATMAKAGVQAALRIKTKRTETKLDIDSAVFLREIWVDMILRAEPRQKISMDSSRDFFFSACRFATGCPAAWAENPKPDDMSSTLVAIAQELAKFADSAGACRPCLDAALTKGKTLRKALSTP